MTTKRRQQPPKPTQLRGTPLHNPVSIEDRYSRELRKLVRAMTAETKKDVTALFRAPDAKEFFAMDANIAVQARQLLNLLTAKFERLFNSHADMLARRMLGEVNDQSKAVLMKSFKKLSDQVALKVVDMPPAMRTLFDASISENVDLIKSIPAQYLDRVKGAVNRSITGTGGIGPLIDDIQKYGGMTERRAKNIALDQTRKAYQTVNLERTKAAGVKKGIWIHTGGTKEPRPKHKAYNGKEFDLSIGAPIGDKGENVMPGECVNCRCTYVPVVDFGDL
jgi:SPP1 gp7 family putative phage head morphogenesis protein